MTRKSFVFVSLLLVALFATPPVHANGNAIARTIRALEHMVRNPDDILREFDLFIQGKNCYAFKPEMLARLVPEVDDAAIQTLRHFEWSADPIVRSQQRVARDAARRLHHYRIPHASRIRFRPGATSQIQMEELLRHRFELDLFQTEWQRFQRLYDTLTFKSTYAEYHLLRAEGIDRGVEEFFESLAPLLESRRALFETFGDAVEAAGKILHSRDFREGVYFSAFRRWWGQNFSPLFEELRTSTTLLEPYLTRVERMVAHGPENATLVNRELRGWKVTARRVMQRRLEQRLLGQIAERPVTPLLQDLLPSIETAIAEGNLARAEYLLSLEAVENTITRLRRVIAGISIRGTTYDVPANFGRPIRPRAYLLMQELAPEQLIGKRGIWEESVEAIRALTAEGTRVSAELPNLRVRGGGNSPSEIRRLVEGIFTSTEHPQATREIIVYELLGDLDTNITMLYHQLDTPTIAQRSIRRIASLIKQTAETIEEAAMTSGRITGRTARADLLRELRTRRQIGMLFELMATPL
ncbi:hypothetical protein ACFLRA_00640 [Bdellovibrionota bacterium]